MTNSSSSSASSSSSSDDDSSTSSSSGGGSHGDKLNSTLNPQISSKIDDDEDAEEEQPLTIQINSKYAREYEIRKRREELTKHHHARNDDDDDDGASSATSGSSSESEDEEGELLTPQLDVQILQTLRALKSGDARLYDKNVKFFDNTKAEEEDYGDNDDDEEEENKGLHKNKPMRYKDVVREQILEQMEDGDEEEGNIDRDGGDDKQKYEEERYNLAYDQEQREIRRAFLESTREDDSEDEICDNTNMKGIKKKKGSRQHDVVDEKDDEADNEEYWIKPKAKRTGLDDGDDDDAMAKRLWEEELNLRSTKKKNKHDDTTTTITGHLRSSSSNDDDDETNDKLLADPKGEIQDGDKFLLEFMTHRKWMEPDGTKSNKLGSKKNRNDADDDEVNDVDVDDDSLDDLDRMDDFESKYNFRFEEANDSNHTQEEHLQQHGIVHYARSSNATTKVLRRKEESRKLKRLARKERKAEERKAKEEKLKRLKNAKRDELRSRMDKLRNVLGYKKSSKGESAGVLADVDDDFDDSAGLTGSAEEEMILKLMEGDYDPDKFEQVMNTAYGEEYYNKEDVMWKSDTDVKLDLMGGDDETDVDIGIADDGIGAMYDDGDDNEDDNEEDYQDEGFEEDDGQQWHEEEEVPSEEVSQLDKKLQSKMMDELYKLDYEDIIGDMPTRFKYRSVEANNYGLSTEEILFARDSTLKQFVSLKKMAPYRDEEEYQPGAKRRKRFRQMAKAEKSSMVEGESAGAISGVTMKHQSIAQQEEQDEDGGDTKKKKRRRQKKSGNSKVIEGGVAATENVESRTDEIKQTLLSEGNDAGGGEGGESEKKRRRRKKKGRRNDDDDNVAINDKSDADNHIQSSTIAELPRPSSSSVVDSQQPKKAPKDKKRKKDKKANKNPSGGNDHGTTSIKKRKSSSKRHAIDGVSGARLAAYGI